MLLVSTEQDHGREPGSEGNFAEYDGETPVNKEPWASDPVDVVPLSCKRPEEEVFEDTHVDALNEMELEKIDQLVSKILEAAETVEMAEPGTEMAVPSVPKEKKTVAMHSIERNVKEKKRKASVKDKDDDFEYDTPEILKTYGKRRKTAAQELPKQKKKAEPKPATKLQKGKQVQHPMQIKDVNCEKYTWKTLKPEVARHYQQFFEMVDDNTYVYWTSENNILGVTRADMKIIVQEQDLDINVVKAYTKMLKKELKERNTQIGLLNIEAAFYTIQHEKKLADFKKEGKNILKDDFKGHEIEIELFLIEELWSNFGYNKVLIPIHHYYSQHYTLLVIDNEKKQFVHMNSMLPPKKEWTKDNQYYNNANWVVKHIRRFIRDVKMTGTIFPGDSQDHENTREKCKGEDSKGEFITEVEEMTEREKEVRRWILDNQIGENDYELVEDLNCPQQKTCSEDCGPFMIHFMESIINGVKPSKKKGEDMRKTILERFAKEECGWSVKRYLAETADAVGEPKKIENVDFK
ncbi:hypothetical protein ABKV19_012123 [Rosa sericea]